MIDYTKPHPVAPSQPQSDSPYAAPESMSAAETIHSSISSHLEGLTYPLKFQFKVMSFSNQAVVTDAKGREVLYTRQKVLNFREHVEIYTNSTKSVKLADIRTKKVIDWSARYTFSVSDSSEVGSVGRKGWKSIWITHYDVFSGMNDQISFSINEENPMAKVFDSILGEIPILGLLTGYLFNPSYKATRFSANQGEPVEVLRLVKKPALFEAHFELEKLGEFGRKEELNLLLSFLMMLMLERYRG